MYMEEKTVITNATNQRLVLDKHSLFEWTCVRITNIGSKIEIKFQRDDTVPYYQELKKLEQEFGEYKIGFMLPTIICPCISIVLFTVFLILFFANRDHFDFLLYFLSILLPALLIFLVGAGTMFLRLMKFKKIETEKPLKETEYKKKIDQIKQPTLK